MKLHWSPRSPYVRKVMIAAHEIGLADRLECVRTVVSMFKPAEELFQDNPLNWDSPYDVLPAQKMCLGSVSHAINLHLTVARSVIRSKKIN